MVYLRDVAQVRDGNPPQTNIVHVDGGRSVLLQVLKNGAASTLAIIDGIKQRVEELRKTLPEQCQPWPSWAISRCSSKARSAASPSRR